MHKIIKIALMCLVSAVFVFCSSFLSSVTNSHDILNGAWQLKSDSTEQVLIFEEGYCAHASYNKAYREFNFTRGGTVKLRNDSLLLSIEFHSKTKEEIGTIQVGKISFSEGELTITWNGGKQTWVRIDKGNNSVTGIWRINSRMQGGKMVIVPDGPRKTLKILSGTRFQWMAINTSSKEFFGCGGGTYTLENGKYTEQIEFFSRDSSRVGKLLVFDAKVENGTWTHSGLSSKGDPVKETWIKHQRN